MSGNGRDPSHKSKSARAMVVFDKTMRPLNRVPEPLLVVMVIVLALYLVYYYTFDVLLYPQPDPLGLYGRVPATSWRVVGEGVNEVVGLEAAKEAAVPLLKGVLGYEPNSVEVNFYLLWVKRIPSSQVSLQTARDFRGEYDQMVTKAQTILSQNMVGHQVNKSDALQYLYWAYDRHGGVMDQTTAREYIQTFMHFSK
jgi:hypothetical protein